MTVSLTLVRRLGFGSLLANIGIVLTGGAVRLTGSGLGCPTWPRCTDDSWAPTAEMGMHGAVEFGNRLLTFVLGVVALAALLAAWRLRPRRPRLVWLATGVLAGIAAQGVIGGITVRTGLNPWIVGSHFLVSIGLIAVAYGFWRAATEPADPPGSPAPAALRRLGWLIIAVTLALLAVGTIVTGSGPHAGDANVARNGLDPQTLSQAHAGLAYLLLGLAAGGWFAVRALPAGGGLGHAARSSTVLVLVILGQGVVGLVQYYTNLPELLVWLHLLGSCLVWVAVLDLRYALGSGRASTGAAPSSDAVPSAAAADRPQRAPVG